MIEKFNSLPWLPGHWIVGDPVVDHDSVYFVYNGIRQIDDYIEAYDSLEGIQDKNYIIYRSIIEFVINACIETDEIIRRMKRV
jgi:hypothetical protein